MHFSIKYDHNHVVQDREQNQPRFERETKQRTRKTTKMRACSIKEEVFEATTSARNVALPQLDKIIDNKGKTQADPGQRVVEDNLDSVKRKSLVVETFSESDMSPIKQNPRIPWREPKRLKKIQTTSLMLRRRKMAKQIHKSKEPVLRLRGGTAEANGERVRKKPDRRLSTGQMNTNKDGKGEEYSGLQRSFSAPQLSTSYTSVDDGCGYVVESEGNGSILDFAKETNKQLKRPDSWGHWELDRQMLRPLPLDSPRRPDLAYLNMTVDEAANEDGIEHFDLAKDAYRRTDAQVQAVREAQRDQRKVAGGIYQCEEDGKENFYLHIMKGAGRLLGIKLVQSEPPQKPRLRFETFAMMDYERYVQCNSQRVRVNLPEETETGFIWYGHGGNKNPLSSSVYKFCERVDNDIHYSADDCERATEAPGASQLMCSSKSCGVIFWHLSVVFFHRVKANHFEEAGQEHFAVMILKSKKHVLLWTDKAGNQTRWTRLEHSPPFEKFQVFQGSMERIRYVVAEGLLPQCNFLLPAYSPLLRIWHEPQRLKRIPSNCKW